MILLVSTTVSASPILQLTVNVTTTASGCQQEERSDSSAALSTGEAAPGILCPVLRSSVQKRCRCAGQDTEESGASLL